jgi:hypothetical protein
VNRDQKAADEHYQQIDFHATLRCPLQLSKLQCKRRSGLSNDIGVIKNG